ncbi:hypothetical protein H2248_007950 [Termitomyces sp. 'cryptogamus']|nr:hypothetical protein H2248_007950 [Termitomyces sp. 'cryptogamus']
MLERWWGKMMDRIWINPEKTLIAEELHVEERVALADIISNIIKLDPTALLEPADLTVQVFARQRKYVTREIEIQISFGFLSGLVNPYDFSFQRI